MAQGSVSIHAPARGAMQLTRTARVARSFNSRTREGCDDVDTAANAIKKFQFTHPRGVRYNKIKQLWYSDVSIHAPARGAIILKLPKKAKVSFNSRTREGCDVRGSLRYVRCDVSIHAPARGAIY